MDEKSTNYGLIERLKALKDLLRQGAFSKAEICRQLSGYYQTGPAGSRRLGRDIRALRQLGYEIEVHPPTHAYMLKEKTSLLLSDSNLYALALIRDTFEALSPISQDVIPLLDYLISILPERQRRLASQPVPLSIGLKPAVDYRPHLQDIRMLEMAINQRRKIRFLYPSYHDNKPVLHLGVEPYEVQFFDRHFYLLGFTPRSPEMSEFRIDHIEQLKLMAGRAPRQRKRGTLPFTYRLSKRIAELGISERFPEQEITLQEDGSAIIHACGYSEFRIIQNLLRYGEQAELLQPSELRARMTQVVDAMSALYAKSQDK
jgi:predicted DNA-binding transcriptional regulator YafY